MLEIILGKKIVIGVDLNLKCLVATSTFYGFGDDCFFGATKDENGDRFVSDWVPKGVRWLINRALEKRARVLAVEALNTNTMNCTEKQKKVLTLLLKLIPYYANQANLKIVWVNPRFTSQICFHCGGRNTIRNDRGIRCLDGCFSGEENADYNAACVVGTLGIINLIQEDKRRGINWEGEYFLATFSSPKPIEEISWAVKLFA